MKMKKILASVAAAALAVSAMATSAFADAAYSGSYSFSDSSWWTQDWVMGGDSGKPVSDLIGDVDPSTVTSITFTSDTVFVIGYNNTDGGWSQPSDETSYTLTDVLLESYVDDAGETHDPALCLCLSKGDGVEYTINWTVEADAASGDAAESTEASFTADLETALYVGESVTWVTAKSDSVNITGAGDYTYSISDLDIAPSALTVIYIKDVAVESGAATTSDIVPVKITYKSLKINGEEVAIKDGAPDGLSDAGVFDCALYNIWDENYIDIPTENINSVELTINVAALAEDVEATEATEEATEAATEAASEEVTEAPVESATEAPVETAAPSVEETTEAAPAETTAAPAQAGDTNAATADKNNADTGIEGVAAVAGLAILAAGAVVIAKKRK